MQFSVSGVNSVIIELRKVVDDTKKEVLDTLVTEIKPRTPIDTGNARRGWTKRRDTVRNDVPYIERLEGGYSKQAPRGFTKQAINATVRKFNKGTN